MEAKTGSEIHGAHGTNRKLARTVTWSTTMATATYGMEVICEGQQWIFDQIQKANAKIAKDISGLRVTTAGCDAIRIADIPPTRVTLDRRAERHLLRLLTQKNSNSDLIPKGWYG
jgi:UTP:GlnB (protein PII) uridylyltransferase